jgi:hypothetical protein
MENSAAHNAISAAFVSPPKSTMLLMVDATEAFSCVMMNTPKKLSTAAMITAGRIRRHLVVTQVAMALGASVQPFTKMTPSVSNVVMASAGFEHTCWMKYENDTSKRVITFFFEGPSCGGSHSADVLIIYGDDYVVWIYPSCHDDLSVCRR